MNTNDKIGEGSYGQVYKISDSLALKRNLSDSGQKLTCLHELSILSKVKGHPLFVQLKGVVHPGVAEFKDLQDEYFHFMLEYCQYDLLTYRNHIGKQLKFVMTQMLLALEYLANLNLGHFDIKPQNILIIPGRKPHLKICDFGISEYCFNHLENTPGLVSLNYRSPEIASEVRTFTPKSDIWSAGCILFYLLRGKCFVNCKKDSMLLSCINKSVNYDPTEDWKVLNQSFEKKFKIKRFNDILDQEAVILLEKMLIIDPNKRISASEALELEYFSEYRNFIYKTRTSFPIPDPPNIIITKSIFKEKFISTILKIYEKKSFILISTCIHAVDLLLRYLSNSPEPELENVELWAYSCLYMIHNIESLLKITVSWNRLTRKFPENNMNKIVACICTALMYDLYIPTFYELHELTHPEIKFILNNISKEESFNGTYKSWLDKCLVEISNNDKN